MNEAKQTRIIIDSDNERDKQDLILLLALFFKERNIQVHGAPELGQASLHGMAGMFATDVMMGKAAIFLEQAPPHPEFDGMPVLKVEVSGPPHTGCMNLALSLKNHLEQLPWDVSLEGHELQMAAGEVGVGDADKNVTNMASNTDTKVVVAQRTIPYRRG